MSKKRKRQDSRWSDIDGHKAFVIPMSLLRHPNFRNLSPRACKMLCDLATQYTGFNNGYLCGAWTLARDWGWASPTTVREALLELEHYGIIERTQQGGRNKPNLYALTFRRIDEDLARRPLDASATQAPRNSWKLEVRQKFEPPTRKSMHPCG